ncbi:MAG: hypothetical protein JSU86_00400 [Phycisphaerales bacterium]|nr:MAG: hypothetical protein JSU86_00400 [Phycisphaerales bacterium]
MFRSRVTGFLLIAVVGAGSVQAADLSVGNLAMTQDQTATVVVSGSVSGESTYGLNILVEILPRGGNTGTVTFTAAPPGDIVQIGDPWPGMGTFSAYDTDLTGSVTLNGSVDDDGNYEPAPVTFSGDLAGFPVISSVDADGIWDVVLSTSVGDSNWELLTTTLVAGTITVTPAECLTDPDCDDSVACTDDVCASGSCVSTANDSNCPDDGLFCTGTEVCDSLLDCLSTGDPCPVTEFCNETTDTCDECLVDGDCGDGVGCTDDACVGGSCGFTANDANCLDDGLYCNGTEFCDSLQDCSSTGNPCMPQICDEGSDSCTGCTTGPECDDGNVCTDDACNGGLCEYTPNAASCDDGLFCTGTEACVGGTCVSSGDPCSAPLLCSEGLTSCVECLTAADCGDGNVCTDDICDVTGTCDNPNNTAPCDDGLFCTLTDVCSGGTCLGGGDPCPGQVCDEANDLCIAGWASLSVESLSMSQGVIADVAISGDIAGFDAVGVSLYVEIVPRVGNVGTVVFTAAPPTDIYQVDDPWPGVGMFTAYDTDWTGSSLLNGSVDDNGTFVPGPTTFTGFLAAFPVVSSADAGGVWDVKLSTSVGNSSWEVVSTTLASGTITVAPNVSLSVNSFAMPPGATVGVVVSGEVDDEWTYGVTIMAELVPRVGASGTLTFTPAPPADIYQIDDPWPSMGSFAPYDTNLTGSAVLNGYVDDNGSFMPGPLTFVGDLAGFPVTASPGADGVWDVTLSTSLGTSWWEGLTTVLVGGSITVTDGACVFDTDCDDSNTCTTDVCIAGVCGYTAIVGACDDGDLCTENDTCVSTTCLGTPVDCSHLDDACNVGTCNGQTGLCEAQPTNEGGSCDDGDLCTENDTCMAGACAGTAVDCSGVGDACNIGTCNPETGACDLAPANDGVPCDDGTPCTDNDVCAGGLCSGTSMDCTYLTDACNFGVCNPQTGACQAVTVNENGPCDDGDLCTRTDRCSAGVCVGIAINCSGLDDACNVGVCNPTNGACEPDPINEGGGCDDGDPCTDTDTCASGVCAGTQIPDCRNCNVAGDCDDTNVCTADVCNAGVCEYVDLTDPCNDGDLCTLNDVCSAGLCAGTPIDCSSFDGTCSVGTCDPARGVCYALPANEGGACNDGFSCTTNDACTNGTCVGTLVSAPSVDLVWSPATQTVNRGQAAQIDLVAMSATCMDHPAGAIEVILSWDPLVLELAGNTDTGSINWLISDFPNDSGLDGLNEPFGGTPANDGDALYQALTALQSGVQIPPGGVVVTTFEFLALDGTVGSQIIIPPSVGSFTETRVLGAGALLGEDLTGSLGSATVRITECQDDAECVDGNLCTDDACVTGVCEYVGNTLPCDDELFCTATDTCSGGACVGSLDPCSAPWLCSEDLDACVECLSAANCEDGNICTDDVCDAFGACDNPDNTIPCDDGSFCTAIDECSEGGCVGTGYACPDEVCDEANDRCVECLTDPDCDDANVCTDDFCNANLCEYSVNTLSCDDGQFCTTTDICEDGICRGSVDPCTPPLLCSETLDACVECEVDQHCNDGNICTTDLCLYNTCTNNANTIPCDDGLFCTATDVCSVTVCVGDGDACPGQLCDEDNDRCVDCFTVERCLDDVSCTVDACVDGVCVNPPNDALCDDGVFCNGPEFCHTTVDCQPGNSPCDDVNLCDEANQACGCQEPIVAGEGSRFLAVTPRPGATPVALLVSGVDQGVSCVSLYVQPDGTLGTTPVYRPPTGATGWNTAHVRGLEIKPETSYIVQAECDTGQGIELSTPATGTTWVWCDTNNSGGLVTISDIALIIDAFRGIFDLTTLYATDVWGRTAADCIPRLVIDMRDATKAVDAFRQFPYPCSDPCP